MIKYAYAESKRNAGSKLKPRGKESALAEKTLRLIRGLKNKNWIRRWQAAYRLGELHNPAATDSLIELLQDSDRDVRKVTLEALGKIADPKAITHIARFLGDQDKDIRLSAIRAFGQMKDPKVAEYLIELLQELKEEEVDIKKTIIHHLGELEAATAVQIILEHIGYEVLESYCARALSKIGEAATPTIFQQMESNDETARRLACLAAGRMRCFEAVDHLEKRLQDPSPAVQQEAMRALAKIGDNRSIELLESFLDKADPLTDEAALHLKRMGNTKAIAYFAKKSDAKILEAPD